MTNKSIWIESLAETLTEDQKAKIDEVAFDEIFSTCAQDAGYLRSIVTGYLEAKTLLEKTCEIASGDRLMTVEALGFDVVTGQSVESDNIYRNDPKGSFLDE